MHNFDKRPYSYTPLHQAVFQGDVAKTLQILQNNEVPVNSKTTRKETPLHFALCHKKNHLIEHLVQHRANPNRRTVYGMDCATMAISNDNTEGLTILIDSCRKHNVPLVLDTMNFVEEAPIHYAACHGSFDCLKLLIEAGANVNICGPLLNTTPLNMALNNGHANCVTLLEQHGAVNLVPKIPTLDYNIPEWIQEGYLNDTRMVQHEDDFGGVLWGRYVEPFYSGKKPRVGLAVQINLNFSTIIQNNKFTWLWGFISDVSADKKTVWCTTKLNVDHQGKIPPLGGQWNTKLQFDPSKACCWVVTEMSPLVDSSKSWNTLLTQEQNRELTHGRRYVKKESPCCLGQTPKTP